MVERRPAALRLGAKIYSSEVPVNHGILVLLMIDEGVPEETACTAERGWLNPDGTFELKTERVPGEF